MTLSRFLAAVPGAVLAFAGAGKVTSWQAWTAAARAQRLPAAVAALVPPAELVLGVCLVVLEPRPLVLGAATFMLLVFTVHLSVQVATGSTVPCACFGARVARAPRWPDVVRNLALMAALFAAALSA